MVAPALLMVLGIIAFQNFTRGTLGQWFEAKFMNRADPSRRSANAKVLVDPNGPAPGGHAGTVEGVKLTRPVSGPTISWFGDPRPGGRTHEGIDIGAAYGTRIHAAGAGTVSAAGAGSILCGNRVTIAHGANVTTVYCHLDEVLVRAGQQVDTTVAIGTVGNTGNAARTDPHLHFEIRVNRSPIDPSKVVG